MFRDKKKPILEIAPVSNKRFSNSAFNDWNRIQNDPLALGGQLYIKYFLFDEKNNSKYYNLYIMSKLMPPSVHATYNVLMYTTMQNKV